MEPSVARRVIFFGLVCVRRSSTASPRPATVQEPVLDSCCWGLAVGLADPRGVEAEAGMGTALADMAASVGEMSDSRSLVSLHRGAFIQE